MRNACALDRITTSRRTFPDLCHTTALIASSYPGNPSSARVHARYAFRGPTRMMVHMDPIRPATAQDEAAVMELALVNDMFGPDELEGLRSAFRSATSGEEDGHQWHVVVDSDDRVTAAAYVAPEPFADRLWNLYFLAVSPAAHGRGTASRLIGYVEQLLRAAGSEAARVLIVETSSTEQYAAARAFYRARGFDEEARIREYYGPGDHKVVYWKALTAG